MVQEILILSLASIILLGILIGGYIVYYETTRKETVTYNDVTSCLWEHNCKSYKERKKHCKKHYDKNKCFVCDVCYDVEFDEN